MTSEGSYVPESQGRWNASGLRIAVLVSRFNADITDRLLAGAKACLAEHSADPDAIDVIRVPGAWELPQTAARIVSLARHDAVVALGCVIRGETPHFDYVCAEASAGLGAVARRSQVPVAFGVLTTDDHAQAMARAGEGKDNKGYETTLAALELIHVFKDLEGPK